MQTISTDFQRFYISRGCNSEYTSQEQRQDVKRNNGGMRGIIGLIGLLAANLIKLSFYSVM